MKLNYLILPIDFLYRFEMPNGAGAWTIGAGPYFGYGLFGKTEWNGADVVFDVNPFKSGGTGGEYNDALVKRFDFGANIQLGYEMTSGFNIGINNNIGLLNIAQNGFNDILMRTVNFGVTLEIPFRKL